MGWKLGFMEMGMSFVVFREHRAVPGVMGRLRVQGLYRH